MCDGRMTCGRRAGALHAARVSAPSTAREAWPRPKDMEAKVLPPPPGRCHAVGLPVFLLLLALEGVLVLAGPLEVPVLPPRACVCESVMHPERYGVYYMYVGGDTCRISLIDTWVYYSITLFIRYRDGKYTFSLHPKDLGSIHPPSLFYLFRWVMLPKG